MLSLRTLYTLQNAGKAVALTRACCHCWRQREWASVEYRLEARGLQTPLGLFQLSIGDCKVLLDRFCQRRGKEFEDRQVMSFIPEVLAQNTILKAPVTRPFPVLVLRGTLQKT